MRLHRLLTIFAAEEIPAAMVTFVSLLMFVQLGVSTGMAVFLSSMLFLPWVLKSFMRNWVRRAGHFRYMIHLSEALLCCALFGLAASFVYGVWCVCAVLFLISMLCAWHELLARMYYERMFRPREQRYYNVTKIVYSHMAVVFTYGALILIVGSMEVFFRQIRRAWAMGCYLTAGLFLFFAVYHLFVLRDPRVGDDAGQHSLRDSWRAELHVIGRIRQRPGWYFSVLSLFLLLLPQSLMFYIRVIFLLDTHVRGGLECTIQEVGFAQGTVGVLAFCIGIALGRGLMAAFDVRRIFWPLAVALGSSPLVYLVMSYIRPVSLAQLCVATFMAQILFGMGLCICRVLVHRISGNRYRNTVNLLYVPLIALCMMLPMSAGGWLVSWMGYRLYFLLDVLSAPLSWCVVACWMDRILITTDNDIKNEKTTDLHGNNGFGNSVCPHT